MDVDHDPIYAAAMAGTDEQSRAARKPAEHSFGLILRSPFAFDPSRQALTRLPQDEAKGRLEG